MSTSMTGTHPEVQSYPPPAAFAAEANGTDELYRAAEADRLGSGRTGRAPLLGHPFNEVLDWSNPPFAKWFADGRLNVAYNCVDRHVEAGNGDRWRSTGWASPSMTHAPSPTPSSRTRCRRRRTR